MGSKRLQLIAMLIACLFTSQACFADYLFGVVPQQSTTKLAKHWLPITRYLQKHSGITIKFATAPSIPEFEKRLGRGEYDFAYMNPHHYVHYHNTTGYNALAKAQNKRIKGIIVVHKDSDITSFRQLHNKKVAFPSPGAFAATLLPLSYAKENGFKLEPVYVKSHDSVYRNIAFKRYIAGGGVVRTLKAVSPEVSSQLRILWTSDGHTPHAIAYHPRVLPEDMEKIKNSLLKMHESKEGIKLLSNIKLTGFESAVDNDWDDIRKLKLGQ